MKKILKNNIPVIVIKKDIFKYYIKDKREEKNGYEYTPIVGLSRNATEEQRIKSLDAGMDGCIFKPVNIRQIKEVFDEFLSTKMDGDN